MPPEKSKPYNTYTRYLHTSRPVVIKFKVGLLADIDAAAAAAGVPRAEFIRSAAYRAAEQVNAEAVRAS